jgi:hypothetical protein
MSRYFTFTLAFAATVGIVILFLVAPAYAIRDAGAKARGEFGTGFWSQNSRSRSTTARVYAPARPNETRQSFSYEPGAAAEGPAVTVRGCPGATKVEKSAEGNDAIANVPQTVRRSFSYEPSEEPAVRGHVYRGHNAAKNQPRWKTPKADRRKYSR